MRLYDMHTHLLPNFDDGAKSVEESCELIRCLKDQGVTNICFTPHFYSNEMSAETFVKERNEAFEMFSKSKPSGVDIVLGAEVYVTKYLFCNDDLSGLTYGNSPYILTEFPYNSEFSDHTMESLYSLIEKYNLIPIIPHIERYGNAMADFSIISELRDMGILIQSNAISYTKEASMFRRRKLIKLINEEMIDIIGTDVHSFNHNSPKAYSDAIEYITKKCGAKSVQKLMDNSEKIFNSANT